MTKAEAVKLVDGKIKQLMMGFSNSGQEVAACPVGRCQSCAIMADELQWALDLLRDATDDKKGN